jgi:hypothetical protein
MSRPSVAAPVPNPRMNIIINYSLSSTSMAYSQPHPRLSVLSTASQSSTDHSSPTSSSTRFSLPSVAQGSSSKAPGPRPNIYERNLNKSRLTEVSASAFVFLFSEIVQYTQKRVGGINDMERRWDLPHSCLYILTQLAPLGSIHWDTALERGF